MKYNLARSYDDEQRQDLSIPLYQEMLAANPDDHRAVEHLIHALLRLERHAEARELLTAFDSRCEVRAPKARAELERRLAKKQESDLDTDRKQADKREAHQRAHLRETAGGFALQRALLRFQIDMQQGNRRKPKRVSPRWKPSARPRTSACPRCWWRKCSPEIARSDSPWTG